MAKLKKRDDGRYAKQIKIDIDTEGKPIKKTIYGKTRIELEDKVREYKNMRDKGISVTSDSITVKELITLWEKKKKSQISDGSYRTIQRDMKKLSKYIGIMKVKDVRLFHVESAIEEIKEGLCDNSLRVVMVRTKELFRYALQKELIYKNPVEFLVMPKLVEPFKRMLTKHEKELFELATLNELERCFVSILQYTGMRRGEVFALSTSDIDLKAHTITVDKTMIDNRGNPIIKPSTKTKAGMRTIPILEPLLPILTDYCNNRIGLLFTKKSGKLFNSCAVTQLWDRILKKVKILDSNLSEDITPHIFRHSFASDLYDAGIDIKRAQYILGHSDVRTTLQIYTHFDKLNLKVNEMNEYYKKSKESQSEVSNL